MVKHWWIPIVIKYSAHRRSEPGTDDGCVAAFFGGVGDHEGVYVHLVASPRQDQRTQGKLHGEPLCGRGSAERRSSGHGVESGPCVDSCDVREDCAKHSELIAQFLATKERAAQAMYTILNEAVATACS
jgi:hypothetical protein